MESFSASEAKSRFNHLLALIAMGEEVLITKREKPIARIVPEKQVETENSRQAVARLNTLRASIAARIVGQKKLTLKQVKSAIAEGRR